MILIKQLIEVTFKINQIEILTFHVYSKCLKRTQKKHVINNGVREGRGCSQASALSQLLSCFKAA